MKYNIWAALLAISLCAACGDDGPGPPPDEQPPETWTLAIYMAADNNLDPFASGDLKEMAQTGPPEGVELLVFIDRSEEGAYSVSSVPGFPKFHGAKIFRMDASNEWEELEDLGEVDSTSVETLHDFIVRVDARDSDRKAFVMWDHGSPQSYGSDETDGVRGLSVTRLQQAFRTDPDDDTSQFYTFDIVGFDTCLLSSAAALGALQDTNDFYIGSAELEPGDGWAYDGVMRAFYDSELTPELLAKRIVSAYGDYYSDNPNRNSGLKVTLAAWRTELSGLVNALVEFDTVFEARLEEDPTAVYTAVRQAASGAHPYWSSSQGRSKYVDFGNLMGNLDAQVQRDDVRAATEGVLTALDDAQIAYSSSGSLPGTFGLLYTVDAELVDDPDAPATQSKSRSLDAVLSEAPGSPAANLAATDMTAPTIALSAIETTTYGDFVGTQFDWMAADDVLLDTVTIGVGIQQEDGQVAFGVVVDMGEGHGVASASGPMILPNAALGFTTGEDPTFEQSAPLLVVGDAIYIPAIWQRDTEAGTALIIANAGLEMQGAAVATPDGSWAVIPWEDIDTQSLVVAPLRLLFDPATNSLDTAPGDFVALADLQIQPVRLEGNGEVVAIGVAEDLANQLTNAIVPVP